MATDAEIRAAYQKLGRTNIDQEGYDYWKNQSVDTLNAVVDGIIAQTQPGWQTAASNAAAIDPGYNEPSGITPTPVGSVADNLWSTTPVNQVSENPTFTSGKPTTTAMSTSDFLSYVDKNMPKPPNEWEATLQSTMDYDKRLSDFYSTFDLQGKPGFKEAVQQWQNKDPAIVNNPWGRVFYEMNQYFEQGQWSPDSPVVKDPAAAARALDSYVAQRKIDSSDNWFDSLMTKAIPITIAAAAGYGISQLGAIEGLSATQTSQIAQLSVPQQTALFESIANEAATNGLTQTAIDQGIKQAATDMAISAGISNESIAAIAAKTGGITTAQMLELGKAASTGTAIPKFLQDILPSSMASMTMAQLGGVAGGLAAALGAVGVGTKEGSTTQTTVPWSAQQPYLTDLFSKAQALSAKPALDPSQQALQTQANAIQQSILNQNASKAFGIQQPVDMAAARANTTGGTTTPNTQLGGQVTQDAYANFFGSNGTQNPTLATIWNMYNSDPVAKQYNPNGPNQNAINYWTQQIQQNGADATKNNFTRMVQQVASTQPPPDQTRASTTTPTNTGTGQAGTTSSTGYSQTLADNNTNPYLNATTTVGTIDPLANNSYLGQSNPYAGLNNPYLTSMINYSNQDIKNAWLPETQRLQRQSGSFGNTGLQQQQDTALLAALQKNSDTLRFQDYTNQQNIASTDLARNAALQQQINQSNSAIQQQNVANSTQAQQADLARNAEIWNAGANRDQQAYQFALNQQLGTANSTPGNISQQQQNLWNPVTQYGKAITGSYGGATTTPTTTNPLISALSGAALGYNLFSGKTS